MIRAAADQAILIDWKPLAEFFYTIANASPRDFRLAPTSI